jgi:hypothetical protein
MLTVLTLILVYFSFEVENQKLKQIIKKLGEDYANKPLIF